MSVLLPLKPDTGTGLAGVPVNFYDDRLAVASLSTVTIVTTTVPVGKILLLDLVEFNGGNIAEYRFKIDGFIESQKWTYFSGPLSGEMFFNGLEIAAGLIALLEVVNFRTESADFHGRILGRLDDA